MIYKEFAELIKEKRIEMNISQKDMAFLIPLKASKYNKIENGKQEPSFFELSRICQILNININEIFKLKKETSTKYYD